MGTALVAEPSTSGTRRRVAAAIFILAFAIFAARLVFVQAIEGPALAASAQNQRLRTYEIEAPRGAILDTNGEVLAMSGERVNVAVNQVAVAKFVHRVDDEIVGTGAAAAADLLAPVLGMDPAVLGGKMVGESTWVYLVKEIQPTTWREIRELGIPGIEPEWVAVREYPNGTVAGNVVGFVGKDNYGLAGLEQMYDEALTGIPGSETVEIGNGGQVIPWGVNELTEAQPGATLHTTINRDLQFLAQEVIDQAVTTYGAQWGGVTVMDVQTGDILVLADTETVDPNDPGASELEDRGGRSVQSPYEPGSTGKLLTLAAAVNEGVVSPTSVIHVPNQKTYNGQSFTEYQQHAALDMTTTGILATSSNIGTIEIGNMLSDETRYEYMRAFGFGEPTGLGLPGESAGILSSPETWDGRTRMTNMFGQGYAITLIQNVAMVNTIANDGTYVAPRLVKGVQYEDGAIVEPEREPSREVLTPEASQLMIDMMESVTKKGGTGVLAAIDGFRVAGKTGTAQTAGAGGALDELVANFVGIVPADNPRFAISVVLYKPQWGYYGGVVAAPVFKEVAQNALDYYGVAPSQGAAPELPWTADGATTLNF